MQQHFCAMYQARIAIKHDQERSLGYYRGGLYAVRHKNEAQQAQAQAIQAVAA